MNEGKRREVQVMSGAGRAETAHVSGVEASSDCSSCRETTRLLIQSRQTLICRQRDAAGAKLRDKKHSFSTKEVFNELRDDNSLLIMSDCDHEV